MRSFIGQTESTIKEAMKGKSALNPPNIPGDGIASLQFQAAFDFAVETAYVEVGIRHRNRICRGRNRVCRGRNSSSKQGMSR